MPNATPTSRAHRLPAALLLAAALLASPRTTHPGLALAAVPDPGTAGDDTLRALVSGFDLRDTPSDDAGNPDSHAVRLAVAPYTVRLAVDKAAVHPLSGPVAVRQDDRLGSLGLPLRLVSLVPAQPPEKAEESTPQPRETADAAPPATREVAVKKPTTPPAAPQPRAPGHTPAPAVTTNGHRILVAGDSLSIYLADALRPLLADRPGTTFSAKGKISSGLARPDFYDWEREMTAAATAAKPDTVVIMIATNDNQTLTRPGGSKVAFGRPGWDAEYARRVRRLVELARLGNPHARIFWVGAPVMANPRLNADVAAINAVIARQLDALPGCRFVDVRRTLADASGNYAKALPAPGGPRTARTPDGVHLTAYGAKLLANATLTSMSPTLAALESR
ncbi:SGNH/GDSL hydrolase family protein [Solidesulfovibrio alcoholivorans]|uniref:SGNH/GDSL hydrolase family protein n=1 Tax=Solidesulfovibrio alcoholivorans TaxID=81406 RepID=UPI00049802B4|nr:DUF459 domain-containing protein [Solidesulfovibrio alcoholivorans]